jgi:LemA protein
VERYPDLKANQRVLDLQRQLSETEDDIASARRYYNAVVRDFNTLRETFPTVLVAAPLGFEPGQYFELSDDAGRGAPSVDLERAP